MATRYAGFSADPNTDIRNRIQQALDSIAGQMQELGETPNWTTLRVVSKPLPTGWSQMPEVLAYGVLLDTVG